MNKIVHVQGNCADGLSSEGNLTPYFYCDKLPITFSFITSKAGHDLEVPESIENLRLIDSNIGHHVVFLGNSINNILIIYEEMIVIIYDISIQTDRVNFQHMALRMVHKTEEHIYASIVTINDIIKVIIPFYSYSVTFRFDKMQI